MGGLINESEIGINCEGSAGLPPKGHYPKKDGIAACQPAAEAVATHGASVINPWSVRNGIS